MFETIRRQHQRKENDDTVKHIVSSIPSLATQYSDYKLIEFMPQIVKKFTLLKGEKLFVEDLDDD